MLASKLIPALAVAVLVPSLALPASAQTKPVRVAALDTGSQSPTATTQDEPQHLAYRVLGHAYTHDGLYLRLGLGFGGFADALASNAKNADDEHAQGRVSGVASVGEIMLGGSVTRRTIIGGGVWTSTVLASNYRHTGGDAVSTDLQNPDNFTLVGPFFDWYLTAQPGVRQSGGFHLQGAAALAVLNGLRVDEVTYDDHRRVAFGGGVMLGFGYEWWVHEQWGLGALLRLSAAGLGERDSHDALYYHGVATFPAFLMTATLN